MKTNKNKGNGHIGFSTGPWEGQEIDRGSNSQFHDHFRSFDPNSSFDSFYHSTLNFWATGDLFFAYRLISHVILPKPFSSFELLLQLILKSSNTWWVMHLILKGSFQGFQKFKFHGNQATLPEVITFFHFCGQNDQFRPRISEMVMWYIKLKPMSLESL